MKPQEPVAIQTTRRAMLFAACGWTVALLFFAVFEDFGARREAVDLALVDAMSCFEKDISYRQWASLHGGVYVPVTTKTPPNSFLADWPERDITTPSGKKLTLMNPAYMTRQVHEWFGAKYGVAGHITSLKPIRPANAADAWETAALKAFEKGVKQVSSVATINGKPVLRFMRPFVTEKACLKCHAIQGYKEGDIRGGISVGVPLEPYLTVTVNDRDNAWLWGSAIWVLGMLGLMVGHRHMKQVIREREENAQHLRETRDSLRVLYDSMLEGMALHEIICDENGKPCDYRFLQVNPAFERLTGLKAANIIGKTVREVIPGIDPKWIERYGRVVLTGESCQFEDYSDDVGRHFEIAAFCPRKGQFGVTFSDITERKKAEEEISKRDAKYKELVEHAEDGIFTINKEGRFLFTNTKFCQMMGYTDEECLRLNILDTYPDDIRPSGIQRLAQLWSGESLRFERPMKRSDGDIVFVDASTWKDDDGNMQAIVRDITERKKAEEALRESRAAALNMMEDAVASCNRVEEASETLRQEMGERRRAEDEVRRLNTELERRVIERTAELQAANKELEMFSSSVSHDLRAPLRSISGFASMVTEDYAPRLDDEGRRLLGVICGEAGRMSQMIDELLSFSRLGKQAMQVTTINMTALAQREFDKCAAQAPGRNIQFKLHPLPSAQGDEALLSHVWSNLISNAIKYTRNTPVAEIEITGRADNGEMVYCVKDNGAGFDMKHAEKLFGVFQRLHAETAFEGTGVGLALAQRIVQRHGGRIRAEAEVNKGATFYFTLPAAVVEGSSP